MTINVNGLRRWGVVSACLLYGLTTTTSMQANESDNIVHDPGEIMEFDSFCASREPYSLSEYASVESIDTRARAIVDVTFTHSCWY